MQQWVGIVLAAGDGSRMKSRIPKPLHRVGGKELIRYPVELLQGLEVEQSHSRGVSRKPVWD